MIAVSLYVVVLPVTAGRLVSESAGVNQSDVDHHHETSLTARQRADVVTRHNKLRANQLAADMQLIAWDDELASTAHSWAALCHFKYREPTDSDGVGQNLYAVAGDEVDLKAAMQSWYDERVHYDYDSSNCASGKTCRHYTQMMWSNSQRVGCSYQHCTPLIVDNSTVLYDDGVLLVCSYKPAGNRKRPGPAEGQWVNSRPFTKGPACSKCRGGVAWCKDGLCSSECSGREDGCRCTALCYNCPKILDVFSCRCFCSDGWLGTDCTLPCEDSHDNCNSTWFYPQWCDVDYVQDLCPVTCHRCTPSTRPHHCQPMNADAAFLSSSMTSQRCRHVTSVTLATCVIAAAVGVD